MSLSGGRRGRLEKSNTLPEMPAPFAKRSSLPPAVVAFDSKGYIHSKKVNNYLIGGTLGEGSFAKVKEAFHVLVGEKVRNTNKYTTIMLYRSMN